MSTDPKPGIFSVHRVSTRTIGLLTLVVVALGSSCTREGGGEQPKAPAGNSNQAPGEGQEAEEETIAQLAYRLRPRLELAVPSSGAPAQNLSPLLDLAQDTPLRARTVLGYGGTEKLPSSKQLAAIEALGTPIASRMAENLKNLQRQDPPLNPEVIVMGDSIGAFKIPIDRPGAEALLLLPEIWDALRASMKEKRPLLAALPSRSRLFFVVDEPKNIKAWGKALQEMHGDASEPMCDRFLQRKNGALVPGKTFAEAAKD